MPLGNYRCDTFNFYRQKIVISFMEHFISIVTDKALAQDKGIK